MKNIGNNKVEIYQYIGQNLLNCIYISFQRYVDLLVISTVKDFTTNTIHGKTKLGFTTAEKAIVITNALEQFEYVT